MTNFFNFSLNNILSVVLLLLSVNAVAAELAEDSLEIEGGYVRGLPPSVKNTSAYMTIKNLADQDLVLTGAKTEIANMVMIHQTSSAEGMMTMQHMAGARLPAHGELVLESGAMHLMIMGLKVPVAPGAMIDITLLFEGGYEYTVTLPVRSVLDE